MTSHIFTSRLEHALVVNRRRYFAFREAGILDRAEEIRLELDYLNKSYWRHHQCQHSETSNTKRTYVSSRCVQESKILDVNGVKTASTRDVDANRRGADIYTLNKIDGRERG